MKRSPKVKRDALKAANGCCQQCGFDAEGAIAGVICTAAVGGNPVDRRRAIELICEVKGWGALTSLLFVDHRVALALGGKDEVENTQVLCHVCHQAKRDQTKIAKCRRVSKRRADFEARMAEKAGRSE